MTLTLANGLVRISCTPDRLPVAVTAAAALLECTPPEVEVVQSGAVWIARRWAS